MVGICFRNLLFDEPLPAPVEVTEQTLVDVFFTPMRLDRMELISLAFECLPHVCQGRCGDRTPTAGDL